MNSISRWYSYCLQTH